MLHVVAQGRGRKNMFRRALLTSLSAGLLLTGCSNTQIGGADRQITAVDTNAMSGMFQAQMPMEPDRSGSVDETDGIWVGGRAVRLDHGDPLPTRWETSGVTLQDPTRALTLRQIANKITQGTHIPIVFASDVNPATLGAPPTAPGGASASAAPTTTPPNMGGPGGGGSVARAIGDLGLSGSVSGDESNTSIGETFGNAQKIMMTFRSGPLSTLLNEVCSYFGLTWRYTRDDGGHIEISRNVIRTYYINALPLKSMELSGGLSQTLNSAASGNGQSTSSSSGGTTQKTTSELSIHIWDEIASGINAILNTTGDGTMTAEPSTGTLSVIAPAQTMDRVQSFVERQNAILSKMVTINVEVISLQMVASDALSLQLNGLLNKANQFALDYGTGGTAALSAVASAGQAVLGNITSSGSSNGTSFLLQELASLGNAEVTSNASVTTLNGLPVPVQLAQTRGYVAEVQTMVTSTSSTSASNSQTTMTPGSVTVGFNMLLLPQVLPDNRRVRLHITSSLSDLHGAKNGFDEFTTGNQTIQLPNIISRNFQQDATIPSGRTIYLSGLQQTNTTLNKSGTGAPSMIALGGSQTGSRTRTMFIIGVTPVILTQDIIDYSDR